MWFLEILYFGLANTRLQNTQHFVLMGFCLVVITVVNIPGEKTFLMVGFEDIILFWNIRNIKNM